MLLMLRNFRQLKINAWEEDVDLSNQSQSVSESHRSTCTGWIEVYTGHRILTKLKKIK